MTVAQEIRAEALCFAAVKKERINEWRREAMSFMTGDSFNNVHKHKRQYKRLHNAVIQAHSAWIDAYGLLEELETSKACARAVYNLIEWSGLGAALLIKAPRHI